MSRSIALKSAARLAIIGLGLFTVAGCGGNLPDNGAAGNPVNSEVAKQQGQSVADYYKKNPRGYEGKSGGGRR